MQETENNEDDSPDEDDTPEITMWEAIAWLTILTLWVSVLSGYLVDAIQVITSYVYNNTASYLSSTL